MRNIIILLCIITLSSCSVLKDRGKKQSKIVDDYCNALLAWYVNSPLKEYLPYNPKNINIKHLSNSRHPNDYERKTILNLSDASRKCGQARVEHTKIYFSDVPGLSTVFENIYFRREQVLADLYSRKITFGQANQLAIESYKLTHKEKEEVFTRRKLDRALDSLQNTNLPKQSNCTFLGNTISCTTY
jgi:hypothetical protein